MVWQLSCIFWSAFALVWRRLKKCTIFCYISFSSAPRAQENSLIFTVIAYRCACIILSPLRASWPMDDTISADV
ncbi:hypothetical protein C8J57DRAFT_339089 [Mycena rebaudengoi]|nr:hypothetical protein C8J57DRAFT_339089 [Mycena rebaudengoi]